jgi:hypothetical protein
MHFNESLKSVSFTFDRLRADGVRLNSLVVSVHAEPVEACKPLF